MPFRSAEAIEAINAAHSKEIRARMAKILENLCETKEVVEDSNSPTEDLRDMLHLADDQEVKYLPIDKVMESANAQHGDVIAKPWYVTESSNRTKVMAEYIMNNCEALIKKVPVRCKEFDLLVSQRIAVMAMTAPLPKETYTEVQISKESMARLTGLRARKQPFFAAYNVEEGALPNFTIADYW